jgi:hypothetical protein
MNRVEGGGGSTNRCTGCIVLVATGYRHWVAITLASDKSSDFD